MAKRDPSVYGDDEDIVPALKPCKGAPNCFSTTGNSEIDAASLIAPWRPPTGYSADAAARDLESVVSNYKPGQAGIDGGGFKVVASGAPTNPSQGETFYLYAQFESLKQGYIDDVEFAVVPVPDKSRGEVVQVLVRSSSRVGYLDLTVNAKRLNFISGQLREKGWTVMTIDRKSHPDYFYENSQA